MLDDEEEGLEEEVLNIVEEEDVEASDTELLNSEDDLEESNFDTDEGGNERCMWDVFLKECSRKSVNDLHEFKEMKMDKVHSDLIVLDYLMKEGYLDVVETFLREGAYEIFSQEIADCKIM